MELIKLEKPVFIEDSFIAPLFNEEFEKVLTEISEHLESDVEERYPKSAEGIARIKSYIPGGADRDDNLVGDTRFIIAEIVRVNRELLARIPVENENAFAPLIAEKFNPLNPAAGMLGVILASKPYMSNTNCTRAGLCMRQIQFLDFDEENPTSYYRTDFLARFLLELTHWNDDVSDDWENYSRELQDYCQFIACGEMRETFEKA